jgi:copper chaperone CopZ
MKLPVIGGIVFLLSGVAALAAVTLVNGSSAEPVERQAALPAVTAENAVVFSVPNMHCEFACAPAVQETLAALPGVQRVETDVEKQTATVVAGDGFDLKKALESLEKAGFPAKTAGR